MSDIDIVLIFALGFLLGGLTIFELICRYRKAQGINGSVFEAGKQYFI